MRSLERAERALDRAVAPLDDQVIEPEASAPTRDRDSWRRDLLLPGLVVAVAVLPKLWLLDAPVFGPDESILLIYPEQVGDGRIPNKDFFTVYGPGNFLTLAGVYTVFGQSLLAERIVGLAYQLAVVTGVVGLTRRHGQAASAAAGLTSAILMGGPNMVALSWFGGLALALWSLVLLQRRRPGAVFIAGVLMGLVTFWRLEMAVMAVCAIPLVWGRRQLRPYVLGLSLGAVPTVSHLAVAGRQVAQNVFIDRMGMNAKLDPAALPPSIHIVGGALIASVLALFAIAAWRRDRLLLSSSLLALTMTPQAFQRNDIAHIVLMTGCVAFPLLVAPLVEAVRLPLGVHRMVFVGAVVGITATAAALTFQAIQTSAGDKASHLGRSLYTTHAEPWERTVGALNRYVPPGSRVFVGSSDMSLPTTSSVPLYQLMPEYRNDFYFIELHVGVAERAGSPLVRDIESADALVLTDHLPRLRLLYPHLPAGSEDANRAVSDGFERVWREGQTSIYVRRR